MVNNKLLWTLLTGVSVFIFAYCTPGSQQHNGKDTVSTENVISEELHQAHCDLLAEANDKLAGINQKVRELNEKIRVKSGGLTDEQNTALDEFEAKQTSINQRMHEIKNVKQDEWESFKTTFKSDLEEIQTLIDHILKDIET